MKARQLIIKGMPLLAAFLFIPFTLGANPLVFGKNRITLISPTLFRIEYDEKETFIDEPTMFAHDRSALLPAEDYSVKELPGDRYEIRTSALRIEFWNNGYPFGESNLKVYYTLNGKEKKFTNRGIYNDNLGASVETLDKLAEPVPMHDGIFARSGWYIVDDEGQDLLKDGWLSPRNSFSHIQDQYCFVYGNDFKAALRDLGTISGRVPLPRRYIFGVWFSRYWYYSDKDLLGVVDDYDAHGFPLDNVVVDMGWHENDAVTGIGGSGKLYWTGYDWNRRFFPDPSGFIAAMHSKGVTVSLNDHPHDGIRPSESCYSDFMAAMGVQGDSILLFSPHDSVYMKNFFRHAHRPSDEKGVDFWWMDWQQNHIYRNVRGCRTSTLKWLNELYWRDSERDGLRGCTFSRWGGWGDHRHPVQFSGDAHITWPMLKFEIKLSSYGAGDGCYFWLHDVGGFKGTPDPEMNVRWTQFGALSAALRIHSTNKAELDRRPWLGTPAEVRALHRAYDLRASLMPYVYSSVRQTHETMVPLNRPMFVEYPLAGESYDAEGEYMFGDQLLCAPVTSPGAGEDRIADVRVWFPAGEVWYDWFTGKRYDGGQTLTVSKPLDEFPLYQKGGWILPLQKPCSRPSLANPDTVVLRVCPAATDCDNTYYLYEDDGRTMEYASGRYCKTALRYVQKGDSARIEVTDDGGEYTGKPAGRRFIVHCLKKDGAWVEKKLRSGQSISVKL